MKLTCKQKEDIYKKWKYDGYGCVRLGHIYGINKSSVNYIIRLADRHGIKIFKHKYTVYSSDFKLKAINRVLNNSESSREVSIELGLPGKGTIQGWIRSYIKNGYSIIDLKRGRSKNENKIQRGTFEGEQETSRENIEARNKESIYKKIKCLSLAKRSQEKKKSPK